MAGDAVFFCKSEHKIGENVHFDEFYQLECA